PVRGALNALKLLDAVADVLLQLRVNCNSPLILQRLAADKAPSQLLLQLTPELRWLVGAIMEQTRKVCNPQWPPSVLALLGRQDLVANFECGPVDTPVMPGNSRQEPPQAIGDQADSDEDGPAENRSIVELCEEALSLLARTHIGSSSSSSSGQSAESKEFSSVSFSRDLRVEEADQLLRLTATVHTNYQLSSAAATASIDSQDSTEGAKALYMGQLARRTLALPAGRALFDYATRNANLQDALAIASPKVCARFRGHKADTVWAAGSVDTSWSFFHSGVAAALSIERGQAKSIHPSWILLNWPSELDVEAEAGGEDGQHKKYRDSLALHAGFLLGMGLLSGHGGSDNDGSRLGGAAPQQGAGPLCDIPSWQALRYLTTRDGLTSIALMLGLACAHRGTMSTSVRRVLSLHIPSLLPPRSPQRLLLSYGTQAAAMLGLGLLFMRSQNRRMVEVMLCELSSIRQNPLGNDGNFPDGSDPAESTAECCSLASGFALGLVVLGQGLSTQTLADLQLLDT
ncbi:Anaphase-promoting complex subunit 1, partial [Coemansia sp. RSA 2052]